MTRESFGNSWAKKERKRCVWQTGCSNSWWMRQHTSALRKCTVYFDSWVIVDPQLRLFLWPHISSDECWLPPKTSKVAYRRARSRLNLQLRCESVSSKLQTKAVLTCWPCAAATEDAASYSSCLPPGSGWMHHWDSMITPSHRSQRGPIAGGFLFFEWKKHQLSTTKRCRHDSYELCHQFQRTEPNSVSTNEQLLNTTTVESAGLGVVGVSRHGDPCRVAGRDIQGSRRDHTGQNRDKPNTAEVCKCVKLRTLALPFDQFTTACH